MADDKSKRGKADRDKVAAGEPYEVNYFARRHGLSKIKAEEIIKKFGPDREAANKAAEKAKK